MHLLSKLALIFLGSLLIWASLILGLWLALVAAASAHEWYPVTCCSKQDCKPIAASDIQWTTAGWLVKATGEIIPEGDSKVRWSEDGEFHRCSRAFIHLINPDRTICLFVPAGSA